MNGNGVWKSLALLAIGMVVSFVGFWAFFAKDAVSRAEVVDMMATGAPYIQDRQYIKKTITENQEMIKKTTEKTSSIDSDMTVLKYRLDQIERKIDILIEETKGS